MTAIRLDNATMVSRDADAIWMRGTEGTLFVTFAGGEVGIGTGGVAMPDVHLSPGAAQVLALALLDAAAAAQTAELGDEGAVSARA